MVFVGKFYRDQIKSGEMKRAVEAKKAETGLNYVNSCWIFNRDTQSTCGDAVWVCTREESIIHIPMYEE